MEKYILYSIIAMVGYGLMDLTFKPTAKLLDSSSMVLLVFVNCTILTSIIWLFKGRKTKITKKGVCYCAAAALLGIAAAKAYYEAFKTGNTSILVPIANMNIAVTVLLAVVLLKEKLSKQNILGIALAIAAVFCLSV